MKTLIIILLLLPLYGLAQSAESSFHTASNHYIHKKLPEAKATVDAALKKYPNDPKLNALNEKLKQEEKQNEQNKSEENKDEKSKEEKEKEKQEKEKQEKQEQEKQKQQQKGQEKKEEKKEQEPEQSEKKEQKKEDMNLDRDKLNEMKVSEEKARMILEAMKNQEKQYLQQKKRKPTKSRDKNKPDW